MNRYFSIVKELEDKLAAVLAEKSLLHVTDKSRYPITLTVTQNQAPDAQMELFDTTDGRMSSRDSVLRFIFNLDGMEIQTDSRFVISDTLMSKVKGLAKKIHAAYVHAYFASTVATLTLEMPEVETERDNDGDFDGFYDDDDDLPDSDVEDIDETEDDE